ncbi:aldo-keto reductase 1 [Spatholobus suberectus]|nr:aldo-keto reductase 1 [Spatholobus suberectus]
MISFSCTYKILKQGTKALKCISLPSLMDHLRSVSLFDCIEQALKQLPREKVQVATKFGIAGMNFPSVQVKGTPDYVRSCCEASLKRLAELGIGIVPYSPLGRGFFGGKGVLENNPANTALTVHHPRFQAENIGKNKIIYDRIESLAKKHQCTPSQLALAWVVHQGNDVVPIPGTTKIKNLDQNIGALSLKFTESDLREISEAVPIDDVAGTRHFGGNETHSWKFANTPPKDPRVST